MVNQPESPASRRPSSPEVPTSLEIDAAQAALCSIYVELGVPRYLDAPTALRIAQAGMKLLRAQHAASVAATEARLAREAEDILPLILESCADSDDPRARSWEDISKEIMARFAAQSAALRASEEANLALREAAALYKEAYINRRCVVCGWPLKGAMEEGCVPGNCCYRPDEPSPERARILARHKTLAALSPPPSPTTEAPKRYPPNAWHKPAMEDLLPTTEAPE